MSDLWTFLKGVPAIIPARIVLCNGGNFSLHLELFKMRKLLTWLQNKSFLPRANLDCWTILLVAGSPDAELITGCPDVVTPSNLFYSAG